jgi:hypothetical protein
MDSTMRSTHFYARHADSKDCIIVLTRLTTKGQPNGKEMVLTESFGWNSRSDGEEKSLRGAGIWHHSDLRVGNG